MTPCSKKKTNTKHFNILKTVSIELNRKKTSYLHNDVVDGNMNEFDKKSDESHDSKTNCCGNSDFLEFCKK